MAGCAPPGNREGAPAGIDLGLWLSHLRVSTTSVSFVPVRLTFSIASIMSFSSTGAVPGTVARQ